MNQYEIRHQERYCTLIERQIESWKDASPSMVEWFRRELVAERAKLEQMRKDAARAR